MAALVCQALENPATPEAAAPLMVLDFLNTFQDENVSLGERLRLLRSTLPVLRQRCLGEMLCRLEVGQIKRQVRRRSERIRQGVLEILRCRAEGLPQRRRRFGARQTLEGAAGVFASLGIREQRRHRCDRRIVTNACYDELRRRKIPCDAIWLDIDYMDGYRVFTFSPEHFPNPRATNRYLHDRGFIAIAYLEAGDWTSGRADAGQFPASVIGNQIDGWSDKWLDIRSLW
jgi:hypothetical protein